MVKVTGWYVASLLTMSVGVILAARHYPGGFDWVYTVASALASRKHNPDGSSWFAGALSLAMILLWPYVSALNDRLTTTQPVTGKVAIGMLRSGLICGMMLGLERLLIRDLSAWVSKAHEVLGILTFLGLYCGILGLLVVAMRRQKRYLLPALLIASPMIAIALTQFWLYLEQRDLGWVDIHWRALGIPFWYSFAFWQWLAIGLLWAGLGLLSFTSLSTLESKHN